MKLNLPPFITTLAMLEAALGLSYIVSHGRPVALTSTDFQHTGIGSFCRRLDGVLHLPSIPVPVVWMIVIIFIASVC